MHRAVTCAAALAAVTAAGAVSSPAMATGSARPSATSYVLGQSATSSGASRTTDQLHGWYRSVHGVRYYRSAHKISASILVLPARSGRRVVVELWQRFDGRWVKVGSSSVRTGTSGGATATVGSALRRTPLRLTFRFAGDSYDSGSSATSRTFVIG